MTDKFLTHLRPFFPSADDFAAATTPHFQFLVDEFGYSQPRVVDRDGALFDIRYDGPGTSVLLNWDAKGGYIGVHLVPQLADGELDPDPDRWLRSNEVLGARGERKRWVTQADLDDVDERGYGRALWKEGANIRELCADILRGDWSVFDKAHGWIERHPE